MGILSFTYNAAKKALRGKNVTPGQAIKKTQVGTKFCLLYTSPSPRDAHESRMPSSA